MHIRSPRRTVSIGVRTPAHALLLGTFALASVLQPARLHAAGFVAPTAEELSMTSLKGYPGAPAVILYREELTKDDLHSVEHYERIKVLTEEGKKYANIELSYFSSTGGLFTVGDDKVVEGITGRTIHPDGTIIPFTGKPYLKVLEKANGYKVQEKVFTLPDVEVGSILEYRYFTRFSDSFVEPPMWLIQDDLFVKEAHFAWWPTNREVVDEEERPINSIAWFPILPPGAKIDRREIPATSIGHGATQQYEIRVKDVPPRIKEDYMPPIRSFSYRVNFSFGADRTPQEYWNHRGRQWSKRVNAFAGPNSSLRDATAKVTAGAATPADKLHKIYSAVMALENTRYTRDRSQSEDKAAGLGQINNAADVLQHGRGTPSQLTELFIGMARAAGLNAYAMWVPDRSEEVFVPQWLDTRQLDDYIAIVNVDGKEVYFDPGARYCAYGQLAWQHTGVGGLRQNEGGTALGSAPFDSYKSNRVTRVANLTMSPQGEITGKIDLTFTGSPALRWRHVALRGDEESLHKDLRHYAEELVPRTLQLEVADVKDVTDYEKPLVVSYTVKGAMGSSMGKRLSLPADLFVSNESATFPQTKRETAVYFEYPRVTQDAVRVNLPHDFTIEATPANARYDLPKIGSYAMQVSAAPTSITTRRDFVFGDFVVFTKDYPDLKTFYGQFETKDQEPVLLKPAATVATSTTDNTNASK